MLGNTDLGTILWWLQLGDMHSPEKEEKNKSYYLSSDIPLNSQNPETVKIPEKAHQFKNKLNM